jgi:hypothetical protein
MVFPAEYLSFNPTTDNFNNNSPDTQTARVKAAKTAWNNN